MCWYGNVGERIIETKLRLQRLNLIAMIGIMYYVAIKTVGSVSYK